jgi:two-component system, NtrC family, sensor histidine kinase AtoS
MGKAGMPGDFYKDVFESTRCGILTIDESGMVTKINPLARSILHLDADPPGSVHCRDLLRDHPALCRILLDSLRMENPPSRFEMELKVPGRSKQILGGTVSHIRNDDGRRRGAALFFKDLTDLEGKEEQERLKERLAALGQMAAGLAHEIRNPLGNIGSTASLLKRKLNANDSGIIKLDSIIQEVGRLNHTVTQCLDYAKPVHISRQPVDLVRIARQAVQDVRTMRPRERVQVFERFGEQRTLVTGDGAQLRQVLQNLISNAFDAMEGEGTLELSSRLEAPDDSAAGGGRKPVSFSSGYLVIRVRDSGPGIPPQIRERLFFPFFTTKPGGAGMGLAVARKIVETHQGILDVESEPGKGATFILKMPLRRSGEPEPKPQESP